MRKPTSSPWKLHTYPEAHLPHLKYKLSFTGAFVRLKQGMFKSWLYTVKVRDDSIISTETTALGHARTR